MSQSAKKWQIVCYVTFNYTMWPHYILCIYIHTVLKYHRCYVDNITSLTHDSQMYSLRLPAGSYLNVPTGHHLAIRAVVDGKQYKLIFSGQHSSCPSIFLSSGWYTARYAQAHGVEPTSWVCESKQFLSLPPPPPFLVEHQNSSCMYPRKHSFYKISPVN